MTPGQFMIVTWDGGGNVPPALCLARQLRAAGHNASIAGPQSLADKVAAAGVPFRPYAVELWPPGVQFEDDVTRFGALRNGAPLAEEILALIKDAAPDVVVVDCMMAAAMAAAERSGLPTAVLVHVLYVPFVAVWGSLFVEFAPARAALGLPPIRALAEAYERPHLVLALSPAELDFPGPPLAANTRYVGPILEPPAAGRPPASADPLVLVSFGTTVQHQDRALPPVLDALAGLPVRGLLTLGGVPIGPGVRVPANVEVHDYLPHNEILPDTAVVVGHGGLSTIMASLAHGVPLVCIPQGRDQSANAERVQACGAGVCLPPDASASEITKAIDAVLTTPAYRDSAQRLAAVIADHRGRALELLVALRETGGRVRVSAG